MPRQLRPQSQFLLRATLALAPLLALWWFALRPPLLAWTRLSTDILLTAAPGASLRTGVLVTPEGAWILQTPVKVAGSWRNVRVDTDARLPTQLTVALPLFWAILLAAGWSRSTWRTAILGTLILLALPPVGLLSYAMHVVQMYVFPGAPGLLRALIASVDYVTTTVIPYVGPVFAALALDPRLRHAVLGE